MQSVILYNKPIGLTPLDAIQEFKKNNPSYASQKMAYAGRLDPMAEGLLLLLVGGECKKRTQYERLEKEYKCSAIFGLESDTYDILGITHESKKVSVSEADITAILPNYSRTFHQPYPPYSAARVNGKPLYYWARKGLLETVLIPEKLVTIQSIRLTSWKTLPFSTIRKKVLDKITTVHGNFRQNEIIQSWEMMKPSSQQYTYASFSVRCSSGTYIRSLIHELGKSLDTGAIAFSIKRTKVGEFVLENATS